MKQKGGNLPTALLTAAGTALMMRRRRRKKKQKGGVLPLAALVPAGIALGKAVSLGAASGAASYGAKRALQAVTKKKRKKRQGGGNIFASAAKMGYTLGKRKDYQLMGLTGAAQSTYRHRKQPWLYKKR